MDPSRVEWASLWKLTLRFDSTLLGSIGKDKTTDFENRSLFINFEFISYTETLHENLFCFVTFSCYIFNLIGNQWESIIYKFARLLLAG